MLCQPWSIQEQPNMTRLNAAFSAHREIKKLEQRTRY